MFSIIRSACIFVLFLQFEGGKLLTDGSPDIRKNQLSSGCCRFFTFWEDFFNCVQRQSSSFWEYRFLTFNFNRYPRINHFWNLFQSVKSSAREHQQKANSSTLKRNLHYDSLVALTMREVCNARRTKTIWNLKVLASMLGGVNVSQIRAARKTSRFVIDFPSDGRAELCSNWELKVYFSQVTDESSNPEKHGLRPK